MVVVAVIVYTFITTFVPVRTTGAPVVVLTNLPSFTNISRPTAAPAPARIVSSSDIETKTDLILYTHDTVVGVTAAVGIQPGSFNLSLIHI